MTNPQYVNLYNIGIPPRTLKFCLPEANQAMTECIAKTTRHAYEFDRTIFKVATERMPNSAFVDVDANIGSDTVFASGLFTKYYAFEIDPSNLEYLRKNVELNEIDCEIVREAVSDRTGEILKIETNVKNVGGSCLKTLSEGGEGTPVESIRLSDYPFRHNLAYIHIDTEGMDAKVLAGAMPLLSKQEKLPLIRFEFAPHLMVRYGSSASDLIRFAEVFDYTFCLRAPFQFGPLRPADLQSLFDGWKSLTLAPWIDLYLVPADLVPVFVG